MACLDLVAHVGVALRNARRLRFLVQAVVRLVLSVRRGARRLGYGQVVVDALCRRESAVGPELVALALFALLDGVAVDDLAVQLVAGLLPGECGITLVIVRV